jgi:sugar phosphate isomerase/epimerase
VLNLASSDAAVLEKSLAHCRRAIDLSAELGAPVYAAHPGFALDLEPRLLGDPTGQSAAASAGVPDYEETYATLLASTRALTVYAKARGVRFLIENHALSPLGGDAGRRLLPMVTSDELHRLLTDVADAGCGVLIDVGHLNVSANALGFDRAGFIERLAPFIGGFHLSGNRGIVDEHRSFGRDAWFLPFLRKTPHVPITIELDRAPTNEILETRDLVASCL